jgi:lysophospholipase L1-like esterase
VPAPPDRPQEPRVADLLTVNRPLTWVFTGDSITQGIRHTWGARAWVEHVHERVRWERGRWPDGIVNTGVAGWAAPDVLDRFDVLVGRFRPDVVSIALGMNDSMAGPRGLPRFVTSLTALVDASAALGAVVVLHTPNTVGWEVANEAGDVAGYAQGVRDVAAARGVQVVDHHARWRDRFGGDPPHPWLDDGVHPNAEGHRQLAAAFFEAVGLGPPP